MSAETNLANLGHTLPPVAPAAGAYEHVIRTGNLLHLSGGISISPDKKILGKLGAEISLEEGREAAEICFLNRLAVIKDEIGTLDAVHRIVSISGFVNSTPDFINQPKVIDAASELAVAIFGESGKHSRAAVGCASLPLGVAVEISMIIEVL